MGVDAVVFAVGSDQADGALEVLEGSELVFRDAVLEDECGVA